MTHEIETHENEAAAVFARVDAWHQLGTTVAGDAFTAEEAMRLGHLGGWNVRKAPLSAAIVDDDGVATVDVPGYATVRTNPWTGQPEALGVVGESYKPLQNEAHAEFLNTLADVSGATFDTAGSLHGGRQVFITMKMPDHLTLADTDRVDLNIAAFNSHDGTSAFRIVVSPVRVVCANTQAAAINGARASVSIRHTRHAGQAVQQARDTLGLTFRHIESFQDEAERMIDQAMSAGEFDRLIETTFGVTPDVDAPTRTRESHRERTDRLCWLFDDARTLDAIRGTRWAGYQAVTEYVDHYAPTRSRPTPVRPEPRDCSPPPRRPGSRSTPGLCSPSNPNRIASPPRLPRGRRRDAVTTRATAQVAPPVPGRSRSALRPGRCVPTSARPQPGHEPHAGPPTATRLGRDVTATPTD